MACQSIIPFTPRARTVLSNAHVVARELNHNYVGMEHILIGLLRENHGIARHILGQRGVTEAEIIRAMQNPTLDASPKKAKS